MSFDQNLSHFVAQSDGVGQTLFFLLLTMSISSWYFIAEILRGAAKAGASRIGFVSEPDNS